MNDSEADLVEALRLALVEAARKALASSCTVHVTRDEEGFLSSEFVPVCQHKREWLRVSPDGRIVDGNTNKTIGTMAELGLRE